MKKYIGLLLIFVMLLSMITVVKAADFSGGGYNFVCVDGGRYLNVYAGKDADGTNVCVWERDGSPEQNYTISSCGGGKYKLYPLCSSSRVIDVNRGNSYNNPLKAGLNVDLWKTNDAPAQEFYITHVGNNMYKIELAALSGCVLQANTPNKNNGNVTLERYTGANNQHWKIFKNDVQVTEPCVHNNISLVNEKISYEPKDNISHNIIKNYDKVCADCRKTTEFNVNKTTTENHIFSDNKCSKCGYEEKVAENKNTEDLTECRHTKTVEIGSLKQGEFKGQKDSRYHTKTVYIDVVCSECGKTLEAEIEKTVDEEHVFLDNVCTICLYQKTTEKPNASTPSVSKTTFVPGESISLSWPAAERAESYDIHIEKPGVNEPYRIDSGFYGNSGVVVINDEGTYRLTLYPVNSAGYIRGGSVEITVKKETIEKMGYVYNTDGANLNIRSQATTKSSVVAKIKEGSTLTVTGDAVSGFYPVKYGNYSGYAYAEYITFSKPQNSTQMLNDIRTSAPSRDNKYYYSNANIFYASGLAPYGSRIPNAKGNCTWYAWGRAYELTGTKPKSGLTGNAYTWWNGANGKYSRGSEPKVGAIAVWKSNMPYSGGCGHVAVVEKIENGKVYISESGYPGTLFKYREIYSQNYLYGYIYIK